MNKTSHLLRGYCSSCNQEHTLPEGNSRFYCLELMERLAKDKRIDFLSSSPSDPCYSTDTLFGKARGKMFGILEGVNSEGQIIKLFGFSGQFNGQWLVEGWVPPLFDEKEWQSATYKTEKDIKHFGKLLNTTMPDSDDFFVLKQKRKMMSQELMLKIHALYRLQNFRGQVSQLAAFFPEKRGVPTGTGDCCAPKLLNFARLSNITPISIAEFFWGKTNKSGTRHHGKFYPACKEKCLPTMGFMLCGLDDKREIER